MVARETDKADNLVGGVTEHLPRGILIVKKCVSGIPSDDLAKARQCRRALRMKTLGLPSDEKLSLKFSQIDIREYPICIGDNPGGSSGTPLSIEWKHVSEVKIGVEEYESSRPAPRDHGSLWMKASIRDDILKRIGYSIKDIRTGTKPVNIERARRKSTVTTLGLGRLHELQEKISRKSMNILSFGARKRKERELMKSFDDARESSTTSAETSIFSSEFET
jgi:hypothetical protein